jgi:hypothetical protein
MSFVPVTGPATFRAAEPPREGVVEFTDARRTVSLPIRAALPVLTRARSRDDLHPTVGMLAGAALLAMRFVAAGKFAPAVDTGSPSWRVAGLDADDEERIALLARSSPCSTRSPTRCRGRRRPPRSPSYDGPPARRSSSGCRSGSRATSASARATCPSW